MQLATCRVPGHPYGRKTAGVLRVEGGLHYLASNGSPYFSLTGVVHRLGFPDQEWEGGCIHERIVKAFPRFADLAALHLSNLDGSPMHAASNGLYWLAGAMGGLGRRYHGGNGHFGKTAAEGREIAKRHFRCTDSELDGLVIECTRTEPEKAVAAFVETLRERWQLEAVAAVKRHGLQVYGDVTEWNGRLARGFISTRTLEAVQRLGLAIPEPSTAAKFAETLRRLDRVTAPASRSRVQ